MHFGYGFGLSLTLVVLLGYIYWRNASPAWTLLRVGRRLQVSNDILALDDISARWNGVYETAKNKYTHLFYQLMPVAYRHRDLGGDDAEYILSELEELSRGPGNVANCRSLEDICFILEEFGRTADDIDYSEELGEDFYQLRRAFETLATIAPRLQAEPKTA